MEFDPLHHYLFTKYGFCAIISFTCNGLELIFILMPSVVLNQLKLIFNSAPILIFIYKINFPQSDFLAGPSLI